MAGMLPPFVPPSVRVASETLPLITEFVVDRTEHSFGSSFEPAGGSKEAAVATLPSIREFVRDDSVDVAHGDEEFVNRTSRSPWGSYEAQHEISGSPAPVAPASATVQPDLLLDAHHSPLGAADAIVNETAGGAEAWAASAARGRGEANVSAASASSAAPASNATPAPSQNAPELWVAAERDAFDWHAAANLAVPPAEERRAAEEWSSTEWERSSGSVQDHVAALLAQVSRRVRAGELEVTGSKQMGPEAALVAVLAALLAEPGRQ